MSTFVKIVAVIVFGMAMIGVLVMYINLLDECESKGGSLLRDELGQYVCVKQEAIIK